MTWALCRCCPKSGATIEGIHEVTEGGAYGFLLADPKDESATPATGRASLVSRAIYQLAKRYTSIGSTCTKDRTITRPARRVAFLTLNLLKISVFLSCCPVYIRVYRCPGRAVNP